MRPANNRVFWSRAGGGRRAFSMVEILVALAIGALLAGMAFSVLEISGQAARRVDFRLALVQDVEPALERVERQLDYMAPYGLPSLDYSREVFEADRLRFFSSRDLRSGGGFVLVELRLESETEGEIGGELVSDAGQTLIVDVLDAEGKPLYRDKSASFVFLKSHKASLAFETLAEPRPLPEPPRLRPLGGARGDRPAGLAVKLTLAPSSKKLLGASARALEAQAVWIPRAGMEAAP